MAYVFNNGQGGVICDQCRILIDAGLSYREYEEYWENKQGDGEFCMSCFDGIKPHEKKARDRAVPMRGVSQGHATIRDG